MSDAPAADMAPEAGEKRKRGDNCFDRITCERESKCTKIKDPTAEMTSECGVKRKREDSCAVNTPSEHDPKRSRITSSGPSSLSDIESDSDAGDSDTSFSHASGTRSPADLGYTPSTASHTHLPYSDPYWREHRTVALPSLSTSDTDLPTSIIWVCGRQIPSLPDVWPAKWPLDHGTRLKKQGRLIADAKEAFRIRLQRGEYVQSKAFQAILAKEKEAHRLRRHKLFQSLVLPVRTGVVRDEATIRRRLTLFKARVGAIDEHERLRAQADRYDAPGAALAYQEDIAMKAWQKTPEGEATRTKSIRLRVGVSSESGLGVPQPTVWLSNSPVTVSNVFTPKEILTSLVSDAMAKYKHWTLTMHLEEQRRLLGHVAGQPKPRHQVFAAAASGEKTEKAVVKDEDSWNEVLERMLEGGQGEQEGEVVAGMVEILVGSPNEPVKRTVVVGCLCTDD